MDEVNTAAYHLWWVLRQQADCLEGVAPAQMNEAPTSGANSPAAVVAHTMAVTRVFVLGFVCGRDVTRDRPAEFRASFASAAAAQVELRALALELVGALRTIAPGRMSVAFRPPAELWGSEPGGLVTMRDCLVEALRHAAIHLGELRLTRTLLLG